MNHRLFISSVGNIIVVLQSGKDILVDVLLKSTPKPKSTFVRYPNWNIAEYTNYVMGSQTKKMHFAEMSGEYHI